MSLPKKRKTPTLKVVLWIRHPKCLKTLSSSLKGLPPGTCKIFGVDSQEELLDKATPASRSILIYECGSPRDESCRQLALLKRRLPGLGIIALHHKPDAAWIKALAQLEVQDVLPLKECTRARVTRAVMLAAAFVRSRGQIDQKFRQVLRASQWKSDFLTNVSHELRIPLNGVLGMVGLVLNTELNGIQREYAETIRRSAESLLMLSNDILDFHKIEAGRLGLEPIPIDLRTTIEELADLLAIRAEEKGLELIVRFPGDVPNQVVGDPGRIRQVLTNLVGNAINFTQTGYVLIEVRCLKQDPCSACLQIRVKDTGIGIPADQQKAIFDKFTQLQPAIRGSHEGTGLGLTISRRLVELMQGEIGVESLPGEGATFWFNLTLPRVSATMDIPARADLGDVRVLIVDANRMNRRVLHEQMAFWGIESDGADSGEEALDKIQQARMEGKPYPIVIVERHLPGMDGFEMGRHLKKSKTLRDTLLVMLTSVGQQGDARIATEIGFSAYLVKPVRQSILHDALATVWASFNKAPLATLVTRHSLAESRRAVRQGVANEKPLFHAKVLVAEDRVVNQKVARMVLEDLGCQVDVVDNGVSVLKILAAGDYDMIFMDYQMPRMNGFETTRRIRHGEFDVRNPKIPIIAMTAHAMEGDREECLAVGMDDYMHKPIRIEDIVAILKRWIPSKEMQPGPPLKTEATADTSPVDFTVLNRLKRFRKPGGVDPVSEMITLFLRDTPLDLEHIRGAFCEGNYDQVREAAHSLKSSAANVGAMAVSRAARDIEIACRLENTSPVPPLLELLQTAWDRSRKVLVSYKESDTS